MTAASETALVDRFAGLQILVVGDVMLDHFIVGRVDRISPEAPVPVVRFVKDESRAGGAGNVARNIAALGGRPALIGVVGADGYADDLTQLLRHDGIDVAGLVGDPSRPTTRKTRIVTLRNQQVARVDYEDDEPIDGDIEASVVHRLAQATPAARAVVISDYRKGVVTAAVIAAATSAAGKAGVPVLVDPKVADASRYRGVTLLTPNHHEAELMTGLSIRTDADASRAAGVLHDRTGASILITRGERGMWVMDTSGATPRETSLEATAREVSDVTGAGDTVIAVLGLGLAAGAPLADAARLANRAAGLVVARFGTVAITAAELGAAR